MPHTQLGVLSRCLQAKLVSVWQLVVSLAAEAGCQQQAGWPSLGHLLDNTCLQLKSSLKLLFQGRRERALAGHGREESAMTCVYIEQWHAMHTNNLIDAYRVLAHVAQGRIH
jgi:hypothetical protein